MCTYREYTCVHIEDIHVFYRVYMCTHIEGIHVYI